ncbi:MAG TPA: NAD(P)H-dependent oxidoreductase subunit E [Chloroflexi bacterium]|nr:NAD(P)H-dependent oxidoreductase subunit E [Chloroflexota bacterium]
MTVELERIDEIIDSYDADRTNALAILQDIQKAYNYLPRPTLERTAERIGVSVGEVYRLATFFKAFSLQPQGEHMLRVCLGTACHVIGGVRILEHLERELGIKAGETTPDGKFSLQAVRCLGACALAPVMVVDEHVHGKVTNDKASKIVAALSQGDELPEAEEAG